MKIGNIANSINTFSGSTDVRFEALISFFD
jgi:hypothetical protein